jgi:hypothetical protein
MAVSPDATFLPQTGHEGSESLKAWFQRLRPLKRKLPRGRSYLALNSFTAVVPATGTNPRGSVAVVFTETVADPLWNAPVSGATTTLHDDSVSVQAAINAAGLWTIVENLEWRRGAAASVEYSERQNGQDAAEKMRGGWEKHGSS